MKWLIPFLFILVGCNSVEPEMGELNGITQEEGRPYITTLLVPVSGTYDTTTPLTFTAIFSKPVTVYGNPRIAIITEFGTYSAFSSVPPGNQVSSMTFTYTPVIGNNDANGIQYSSSVVLGFGGSIYDPATNIDANLTLPVANTSGIVISTGTGPIPTVAGVYGGAGNVLYGIGDVVELSMNFSEAVSVTDGTPSISLNINGTNRTATFVGASNNSTSLRFQYIVEEGVQGNNITATLNMPGTFRDSDGNVASISIDPNTAIDIDGVRPTIVSSTALAGPAFTSMIPMSTSITWSEPINIDNSSFPRLNFVTELGARAMLLSGWTNGSSVTTFSYTPGLFEYDFDLVAPYVNSINDNGAVFSDAAGNPATSFFIPAPFDFMTARIAPSTMQMWYDLSFFTPGASSTLLTSFFDLLNNIDGTPAGGIAYDGSSASFTPVNVVNLQDLYTAYYVVLVVDSSSSGIVLSNTISETMLSIGGGAIASVNCNNACKYFDSSLNWNDSSSGNLGFWMGSGSKRIIAVNLKGAYFNRTLRFRNMKLYEAHFYSNTATETEVSTYVQALAIKHGITL